MPSSLRAAWPMAAGMQLLLVAFVAGAAGYGAAWLGFTLLVVVLGSAPFVARAQLRVLRLAGPERIVATAGAAIEVELTAREAGHDVLVRLAEPWRSGPSAWAHTRPSLVPRPTPSSSGASITLRAELRPTRRGRGRSLAVEVESSFPFGLCHAERRLELPCEFIVHPRPLRPGRWTERALRADAGTWQGRRPDPEGEFHSLAEWRPGEPTRRLRPKLSLRLGRPVREVTAGHAERPVRLVLVLGRSAPPVAVEQAVSAAATLLVLLARRGTRLELAVAGARAGPAARVFGARAALDVLADVAPARAGAAALLATGGGAGDEVCVVAAEPGLELAACLAAGPATVVLCNGIAEPAVAVTGRTGGGRGR